MSYSVASLEPKAVWDYFDRIRQIPHGSGNEKRLAEAILSWAKEKGCEAETDAVGNVVIRIPASAGREQVPPIILQGHIDMVCEKNADTEFDFTRDAIQLVRDGEWIKADGTTLGADNGIGVAIGLAFMDSPETIHGPLEILLTIDEETGLNGARGLKPEFLKGRMLFNLDSEEDGIFYVGCAGGRDADLTLPLSWARPAEGHTAFEINVRGLRGGHSGQDIVHNRGNAIRLVARALRAIGRDVNLALVSIDGGDKHNAIPREARAVIAAEPGSLETIKTVLAAELDGYREEFASAEPELEADLNPTDGPAKVLDQNSRDAVLRLILGLPHGVLAMMRDMPGQVETSNNVARVRTEETTLTILTSTRSSIGSAIDGVHAQIESIGLAVGAQVSFGEGYPGWKPNLDSPMLAKAKSTWEAIHGSTPRVEVIHAGLECGIIGEKLPGIDMISLGPTIENPHSPDERVQVESVGRFFDFTKAFLEALAKA